MFGVLAGRLEHEGFSLAQKPFKLWGEECTTVAGRGTSLLGLSDLLVLSCLVQLLLNGVVHDDGESSLTK